MRPGFSAAAALLFAACSTPASRIKRDHEKFESWPPAVQEKVRAGDVSVGFTEEQTLMALGRPTRRLTRETSSAKQDVWVYGDSSVRPGVGFSIGSFGGSSAYGGGVGVSSSDYGTGERARVVFEEGRVVAVEKAGR